MSHRTRKVDQSGLAPVTAHYGPFPQIAKGSRTTVDKASTAAQRLSMASTSSGGRRSSTSLDSYSGTFQPRPSGIPRPTRTASNTRANPMASSRPTPAMTTNARLKPTSAIAGISARATSQNRGRGNLVTANRSPRIVTDEDLISMEPTLPSVDVDGDTVFGVAVPQKLPPQPTSLPSRLIPELQALAAIPQRRPTPAMSTISTVSSPSTQFTASPSPWSASTTTTTPISWSSASPSVLQSTRAQSLSKRSQTVPLPTVARTLMPKLSVLQETNLSSASSSNTNLRNEPAEPERKLKKKTPFGSPAPTPPPRSSSIKRTRSRSGSKSEDDRSAILKDPTPPLPSGQDVSSYGRPTTGDARAGAQASPDHTVSDNHQKLQDAINSAPPRPSRDDTQSLAVRRPQRVNTNHTKYNEQARKLMDAAPIDPLPKSSSQLSLQSSRTSDSENVAIAQSSRSKLTKFSKMALFGRSPKKESRAEEDRQRQSRKLQRRGPAAGTGHEGYGRFGRKERKTPAESNNTGTDSEASVRSVQRKPMRSTSRSGSGSSSRARRDVSGQSDLDDFAASRLKPVVILGGSYKGSESATLQSERHDQTSPRLTDTRPEPVTQEEQSRASVASSGPLMRESRLVFHLDSLDMRNQPSLAYRRSQKLDRYEDFRIPEPINTSLAPVRPYVSGYNTSQSSIAPTSAALTDTGNDFCRADFDSSEKPRKKGRKLNWNIFKKKEALPVSENYGPHSSSRVAARTMAVRITEMPPARPTPYYAMLESENEVSSTEAIGDFLTEAARAIPDHEEVEDGYSADDFELGRRGEMASVLLPSAPHFKRDLPPSEWLGIPQKSLESRLESLPPSQDNHRPRQPRLAQVGRIPKVVSASRTDAPIEPSLHQAYQHTAADSTQHPTRPAFGTDSLPPLAIHTDLLPSRPFNSPDSGKPATAPIHTGFEQAFPHQSREHLRPPERYSTTSSSSDGMLSILGPPLLPLPEVPRKNKRFTTTEEDVWNEYDDFIDRVISPPRLKKSTTRISDEHRMSPTRTHNHDAWKSEVPPVPRITKGLAIDTSLAPPPLIFTSPSALSDTEREQDFRLRRSRIVSALHSSLDPSSPFSIGDYLVDNGDRKWDGSQTSRHASGSTSGQTGPYLSQVAPVTINESSTPIENKQYASAVHMDELQRAKDPIRHSEQSYASLMISRWLSFDQVLFSPAHAELQKQPGRHVLVIDGLGNDDWSIYCAVTYQAQQAYIHDLKESAQAGRAIASRQLANAPANFRRCELGNFDESFKFPDNFFSVIVLRFLPVMAESKLRNIISECRRVLVPGGYMELMLLELDISNMGVTTRRAMREVKTQMAMRNREVSLKPVIDSVQSVLGEKGFSSVRRFMMGLPVVGKPAGTDSPVSSRSSGSSDRLQRGGSTKGSQGLGNFSAQYHNNFSLSDLVADHSDNADAKIGRVVSRTARSWWQHCFETAVISDGNLSKSIFADKHVLSECKARGSCFKFLIAHAQKPLMPTIETKRRTMSEPVIATLATA